MSTTIDSLALEIKSDVKSATSGIDALSASLTKLKTATKGGLGLISITNQFTALNSALSSVDISSSFKLNNLATSLSKLSTLGNVKISSSIGNQIKNIGAAITSLDGIDCSGINNLVSAIEPLSTLSKSTGLQSAITQLNKLPQLADTLNGINWSQFGSQIQQLVNTLAPLAKQLNTVSAAFGNLPTNIQRTVTATNSLTASNTKAQTSYVNLWAKLNMAYNGIKQSSNVVSSWINESNEYIEDVNLFTVAMGEYAESAREYAEKVSEIMGIDPADWMRNQGVFMTITKGFGVASNQAALMSQNLTQLGYDIASFYNINVEDAMTKLTSGISGELEPLRRLGYDLSVARLQQEALNLGIEKSVSDMTQAEKAQLRYYAIMTQVTDAQGDMARTLNTPANQIRILRAQVTQLARALGNIFIPALTKILPYVIAFTKVVRMAAEQVANFFGFTMPEVDYSSVTSGSDAVSDLSDSVNDTASGLSDATDEAKKLSSYLMGIDELNVISSSSDSNSSSSSDDSSVDLNNNDLGIELPTYDFLDDLVSTQVDEIVDRMKEKLKELLPIIAAIGAAILAWKLADDFANQLSNLAIGVGAGLLVTGIAVTLAEGLDWKGVLLGAIGGAMMGAGIGWKIGGASGALAGAAIGLGLGISIIGVTSMISEGVNVANTIVTSIGTAIAGGMLGWTFSSTIGGALAGVTIGIGVGLLIAGIISMIQEGVNIQNALLTTIGTGVIGAGLGWALSSTLGGALAGVTIGISIGLAITAITSMIQDGVNLQDAILSAVSLGFAGGLIGWKLGGIGGAIAGLTLGVSLSLLITGITSVFQEGVNVSNLIEIIGGALGLISSLVAVIKLFNKNTKTSVPEFDTAGETISDVSGKTSTLTNKLKSLATNLGLGVAIIAEVCAAALIIVGSIALLGLELQAVNDAWTPVIENGSTTAITVGSGTAILAAVGVATYALGSQGATLVAQMAIGTAILAEIGAASLLFIAEIWAIGELLTQVIDVWQPVLNNGETVAEAIGWGTLLLVAIGAAAGALGVAATATAGLLPVAIGIGTALLVELGAATLLFVAEIWTIGEALNQVGTAWQPVLDNGEAIKTSIEWGTSLLVAIGVVTAALGVASVASVGQLPLAIGLGTALLVELAAAFVLFCESLVAVANELGTNLAPALANVNGILPSLTTNMHDFVTFMTGFCEEMVEYTKASAVAGIAATVDTIIGWFTEDPIEKLADEMDEIYSQTQELNAKLNLAVPELKTAVDLMQEYDSLMTKLEDLTKNNHELSTGMFVNMKEVGQKLVTGFVEGIESKSSDFKNAAKTLIDGFKKSLEENGKTVKSTIKSWADNIKDWFTGRSYGAINDDTFKTYAKDIVTGFQSGINNNYSNSKSSITSWANDIKSWFANIVSSSTFDSFAKNIISGFNGGISNNHSSTKSWAQTWGKDVTNGFSENISYNNFWNRAVDVINGFNNGIGRYYTYTRGVISDWANDLLSTFRNILGIYSPSKEFYQFGAYAVEGYNNSIKEMGKTSVPIMEKWGDTILASVPDVSGQLKANYSGLSTDVAQSVNARVAVTDDNDMSHDLYSSVYTAIINALQSEYGNQEIKLMVDGKQISNVVTHRQRQAARAGGLA